MKLNVIVWILLFFSVLAGCNPGKDTVPTTESLEVTTSTQTTATENSIGTKSTEPEASEAMTVPTKTESVEKEVTEPINVPEDTVPEQTEASKPATVPETTESTTEPVGTEPEETMPEGIEIDSNDPWEV